MSAAAESESKSPAPEAKAEEEVHSMALSIDIRSVKGLPYEATVGISYSLPVFDAQPFASTQPVRVPRSAEGKLYTSTKHR